MIILVVIEFGLAKLISLVIGLFAKLIGLGGLAKRVTKIFKKIRKRIDKAISKLLRKARKAGRKIMRKLGIGKKEKPKTKEEHDEHVKSGMAYLHKQEKKLDEDGDKALTEGQAKSVASKTKKKFKVFDSITPKKEGSKWVYHWKGSQGSETGSNVQEGGENVPLAVGQLIKALYVNGMWVAKITKIDEDGDLVIIKYEDSRKGVKRFTTEEFNDAIDNEEITKYEKRSNRSYYMGSNPSRHSDFGTKLKADWKTSGPVASVSSPVNGSYNKSATEGERIWWNGEWIGIDKTDLGHYPVSAVAWWNSEGYMYGPQAPEVRKWMNDHKNYRFEESGWNRSQGALSGDRYRLPYQDNTEN